jgi:CubicO group peptidase (beta-lactamase class C family)
MKPLYVALALVLIVGCAKDDSPKPSPETMYFPPVGGTAWETKTPSSLGWNEANIPALKEFLIRNNTKSFIILVNGRIVMEEYFSGHTSTATWQWNSAGKTLAATVTGIAQQEGLLSINDKVNSHLGLGWTSAPLAKENLITVLHLLTMTTGLNDASELVIKPNLTYLADAGTRWSYHNVFQKLMDVTAAASGQQFETYFNSKLKNRIGMDGFWNFGTIFYIYHSNTRSMARFGLLALNKGKWGTEQVVNEAFFNQAINTSQVINPSYGYLWWLNGKSKYMLPGEQTVYPGTLVPNAPSDMFAAMGAADQRIYVVPGKNMVVIRMGEASNPDDPDFAASGFDNALWGEMGKVIK